MSTAFIGMDEAGLGPNLGPLVVSATAWNLPDVAANVDFYQILSSVVDKSSTQRGTRLHVADSKQVYSPSTGLAALERSALALLGVAGCQPATLSQLIEWLSGKRFTTCGIEGELWPEAHDLALPIHSPQSAIDSWISRLKETLSTTGIQLESIQSDIVFTRQFNSLINKLDNKSLLLSTVSLNLLRQLWQPTTTQPVLVVGDKHGGRNRYDHLLAEIVGDAMIFRLEEGPRQSRYRVGSTEIRFQVGGEDHLPVAAASIVSKYVRELVMEAFNNFWQQQLPDLQPTKGYPLDAKRFRVETSDKRQELNIADSDFWRSR